MRQEDTIFVGSGMTQEQLQKYAKNKKELSEIVQQEKEQEIKLKLSDEFLETLVEVAKTCGWEVDYIVLDDFVSWCFEVAGKEKPSMDLAE